MATNGGPKIIKDGLVFAVDAANKKSYPGSGTTWTEQAKLLPTDPETILLAGESVAVSGDTILVGSRGTSVGGIPAGATYVFVRSGSLWTQQARLVSADLASFDSF